MEKLYFEKLKTWLTILIYYPASFASFFCNLPITAKKNFFYENEK